MAKKVTLKKTVVKQSEEPLNVSSLTLDVSEEFILFKGCCKRVFVYCIICK